MPFVVISDPVEAHRYRQAGMLWLAASDGAYIPIKGKAEDTSPEYQKLLMKGIRYAILVEEEDE